MKIETAIVIPTYNEKKNVPGLCKAIHSFVPSAHIFFVDDNSPDGTGKLVESIGKKNPKVHLLSRAKKEGIGRAYIDGFTRVLAFKPKYIIQMDADFSHDPSVLPVMLEEIKKADLVIGSRYLTGISVINWPLRRVLLSYFANMYVRFVTRIPVRDATGGFKCFKSNVLSSMRLDRVKSDGYSFQIEMNYLIHRLGFKIVEVPIVFIDRHAGTSKMSGNIIVEALSRVPMLRLKRIKRYDRRK